MVGTTFDELDTEAVIARRPEVALIDELAHTNIPGSGRGKRWEDVLDILVEGITVITTLNVQHLASVNDVVAEVTGIRQQETVPDCCSNWHTTWSSSTCRPARCSGG
jgi:two-component system sensor histidine kinase KdpD